jgi:hypothetical protein
MMIVEFRFYGQYFAASVSLLELNTERDGRKTEKDPRWGIYLGGGRVDEQVKY